MANKIQLNLTVDQFRELLIHCTSDPSMDDIQVVYSIMCGIVDEKCRRIQKRNDYSKKLKNGSP